MADASPSVAAERPPKRSRPRRPRRPNVGSSFATRVARGAISREMRETQTHEHMWQAVVAEQEGGPLSPHAILDTPQGEELLAARMASDTVTPTSVADVRTELVRGARRMARRVDGQVSLVASRQQDIDRHEKRLHEETLDPLLREQKARLQTCTRLIERTRALTNETMLPDLAALVARASAMAVGVEPTGVDDVYQAEVRRQREFVVIIGGMHELLRNEMNTQRRFAFAVKGRLTQLAKQLAVFQTHMLNVVGTVEAYSMHPNTVLELWSTATPRGTSLYATPVAAGGLPTASVTTPSLAATTAPPSGTVAFPDLPFDDEQFAPPPPPPPPMSTGGTPSTMVVVEPWPLDDDEVYGDSSSASAWPPRPRAEYAAFVAVGDGDGAVA